MSVLISDSASCTSVLGRILFQSTSDWSARVEVLSTAHEGTIISQHTTYQLLVTVVPRNSLDLDERNFSLWTRYKNLLNLWNQLSKLHQQLCVHGTMPEFASTRLFGRGRQEVIEDRIEAMKQLLNFVFASEVLRKSKVLQQFVMSANEVQMEADSTPALHATNIYCSQEDGPSRNQLENHLSNLPKGHPCEKRAMETDFDEDCEPRSAEHHSGDTINFSSKISRDLTQARSNNSAMLPPNNSMLQLNLESSLVFDFPDVHIQEHDDFGLRTTFNASTTAENGPNILYQSAIDYVPSNIFLSASGQLSRTEDKKIESSHLHVTHGECKRTVASAQKDYLFEAAQLISVAQKAEVEKAFELSFYYYKAAVNVLVQGVKKEANLSKANVLRQKAAKYLLKAEDLYRSYLCYDGSKFNPNSWMHCNTQDPGLLAFQSSSVFLKFYSIISILPAISARSRVYLARDKRNSDGAKFILKLMEKSSDGESKNYSKSIPMGVSNMVQLIKFFDIEHYFVLMLESMKCGLFDYLGAYIGDIDCKEPLNEAFSTYEGNHLNYSAAADDDLITFQCKDSSSSSDAELLLKNDTCDAHSPSHMFTSNRCCDVCQVGRDAVVLKEMPCNVSKGLSEESAKVNYFNGTAEVNEETPAHIILPRKTFCSLEDSNDVNKADLFEALACVKKQLQNNERWEATKFLPEILISYWIGQLADALNMLHSQGIIICDLQPKNLLLDCNGKLKLTFCGEWNNVRKQVDEEAIHQFYCAPELHLSNQIVTTAADWWSLGVILFEILCRQKFGGLFLHRLQTSFDVSLPENVEISLASRDLLSRLLVMNPAERLSDEEVISHPFFVDFSNLNCGTASENPSDHIEKEVIADLYPKYSRSMNNDRMRKLHVPKPLTPEQLLFIIGCNEENCDSCA